jgi:hypothetical protein
MPEKIVGRATSIFVVAVVFLVPLSVQPCQMSEVSNNPCCCCSDSPDFSEANHREQQECGCHMGEKHQEENSPAFIVFHHGDKLGTSFVASEVEVITKDYRPQFTGLYSQPFLPTSKDPPLYLLHSSFLI